MDRATAERELGASVVAECRRRLLGESLPRLERCLDLLGDDEVWQRPNPQTPSVGNLVLHLAGNVRQWVVSAIGGAADRRQRPAEFAAAGPMPVEELRRLLGQTLDEAGAVLDRLDPGQLLARHRVQGFEESALAILIHVVEHFSYHVGQVSYVVRSRHGVDLGYYRGVDLERKE
jgi:uncharacterized damage-inducible protein DinB